MTTHDQDAEVGRLVRERREARAHLETLTSSAQKQAKLLASVAHFVFEQFKPGRLHPDPVFRVEPDGAVSVSEQHASQSIISGRLPTAEEIQRQLAEIKQVRKRLGEIDEHLKALGGF